MTQHRRIINLVKTLVEDNTMKQVKNFFRTATKDEAINIINSSKGRRIIMMIIDFDEESSERIDGVPRENVIELIEKSQLIKHGLSGGVIINLDLYFSPQDPDNILPKGKMNNVLLC